MTLWSSIQNAAAVYVIESVCSMPKLLHFTSHLTCLYWYIFGYWPGRNSLKCLILFFAIVKSFVLRLTGVYGMNKITVDLPPASLFSASACRRPSKLLWSSCSSTRAMSIPPSSIKGVTHNKASIQMLDDTHFLHINITRVKPGFNHIKTLRTRMFVNITSNF